MGSNLPRILHFGVGNFHRAHQAWYTQTANALHPDAPQWRITGVSLRSAAIRDALVPQRYAYTLAILDDQSISYNQITVHDAI
ncbi:MAG: fructuronate reductase, partial [Paracoccaceae bacterium]